MEGGTGLLEGLVDFPVEHMFNVVVKLNGADEMGALDELSRTVSAVTGSDPSSMDAKPRTKTFTSVSLCAVVASADQIREIHEAFMRSELVTFSY